jgi:5-(aminomethyl)-3-furanmethanol phosphate kinase
MPPHTLKIEGARPHLVVKLGGSLWRSPLRAQWIAALRAFPGAVTLVAGGGPFADAVRAAEPQMGFSPRAAHGMALLAMEQYALALADLHEGLTPAASLDEARAAHEAGRIAVWRPFSMVQAAAEIEASWDVTSDSLSAWFAKVAGAEALLLIKSVDVDAGASLGARGLVDPAFARYATGLSVFVAGPGALAAAAQILAGGRAPGVAPPNEETAS